LNYVIFPAKIQISKHIDVPYIHVYVWFKDAKHVIWMWILLIPKNINLLDRIWSSLANKLHILAQQVDIFGINQYLKSLNIEKISTYDLCNPGPSLGQAQNYLYIVICDTPHVVVLFIDCKHQQQIVWVLWFFIAVYVYVIWMWINWYRKR
jgi:hypothetical protein